MSTLTTIFVDSFQNTPKEKASCSLSIVKNLLLAERLGLSLLKIIICLSKELQSTGLRQKHQPLLIQKEEDLSMLLLKYLPQVNHPQAVIYLLAMYSEKENITKPTRMSVNGSRFPSRENISSIKSEFKVTTLVTMVDFQMLKFTSTTISAENFQPPLTEEVTGIR